MSDTAASTADAVPVPAYATPVSGPAQGRLQRVLATLVVAATVAGLLRLEFGTDGSAADLVAFSGVGLAALLVLLAGYWFVMTGTTTIDAEGIAQSGLPERRARWDEIQYATLGGLPFVAPARRLRVRTTRGRRIDFGGASPELHAAFVRIAAAFPPRTP